MRRYGPPICPEVTLIRHVYVSLETRGRGLQHNCSRICGNSHEALSWSEPGLMQSGRFGSMETRIRLTSPQQKDGLLKRHWKIPELQAAASVVLVDASWRDLGEAANSGDERVASAPPDTLRGDGCFAPDGKVNRKEP